MLTGEFTGIKVLATVTVAVATLLTALAVYLWLSQKRQNRNVKGEISQCENTHLLLHFLKKSLS